MSTGHLFVKYISLLCVIQLSIFLVSCGGSPLSEVTVTATVLEGFTPLNVTFHVGGPSSVIAGVTWDFDDGETAQTTGTSSISHTFVTPGKVTVSATVNTTSALSGDFEFKIPLTVLPNVNLIVSSFAIDTEVTPRGLETVSAIIQNVGTDTFTVEGIDTAIAHIDVGYYLSTDDIITVDDIFIGDTSIFIGDFFTRSDIPFGVQSLAPGENYQYDHQLAVKGNVPAGTYFAGAIVDYIDEFHWYTFPRSTDTLEFTFPSHVVVPETNEEDNVRLLPAHQVTVTAPVCVDDPFEPDNSSATATLITVGDTQVHNFCFDNSDWLQFDAAQGNIYKITTFLLDVETDTQLILYDTDGSLILLFHDNMGNTEDVTRTVDLESDFPPDPASEIVWEAQVTGTYFIKVRTTACDEDKDPFCETKDPSLAPEGFGSPDGVGLDTGYSITLQ
jgi:PKD repeat protein